MREFLTNPEFIFMTGTVSVAMFFGSIVAAYLILIRLPEDFFLHEKKFASGFKYKPLNLIVLISKNILGYIFIAVGILLIFLPGQGVLTILLGVMLADFPFKKRIINYFLAQSSVQKGLNKARASANKTPFRFS